MSEAKGPYRLINSTPLDASIATVDGGLIRAATRADAERIVADASAHHHAIAAQAERVAGLEAALKVAREFIDEASCLNDDDVAGFVDDGYFAVLRKIDALTPPAKGGT